MDEPFWSFEPREITTGYDYRGEMQTAMQQPGSFPYGVYPKTNYYNGIWEWRNNKPLYCRPILEHMLKWCKDNNMHITYSEKYGSFYFKEKEHAALFLMFFENPLELYEELSKQY